MLNSLLIDVFFLLSYSLSFSFPAKGHLRSEVHVFPVLISKYSQLSAISFKLSKSLSFKTNPDNSETKFFALSNMPIFFLGHGKPYDPKRLHFKQILSSPIASYHLSV